jgi:SlyX protein
MSDDRLTDLETRLTYQEDQIEALNKTVYQQQQEIERLQAFCEALARQLRALADTGNDRTPAHERPPHY